MRLNEKAYTIPELLVVMLVTTFFTSLLLVFTINYWRYGSSLEADLDTLGTRLNASDFLRDAVGVSTGLIMQTSIPDAHATVPDPSVGTSWVTIHAIPGSIPIGSATTTTPVIYYRRPALNATGNYIMNGTQPYEDEYVLYLDGSTKSLKQRSLANTSATGDRLKTSCPAALATTSCPADKTVATDITSISMRYFSRTGNTIDYTSIWDGTTNSYIGPDFTAVEVVEFTLNLSKKPLFQKTSTTVNNTIVRIALRNS
jgi:hypothetical protein